MPLQAIFFDAGNTLIFPDRSRTLAPLQALGIEPPQELLWAAERAARTRRDKAAADGHARLGDQQYWDIYYNHLLEDLAAAGNRQAGGQAAQLKTDLIAASRKSANWEVVLPGTREVLLALKQRYRLAVISNSDGHMEDLIAHVGLRDCFETVVDSGSVGVEKPDPRIFQEAATVLAVNPAESLYVGDVYSIDYVGAKGAGFDAVLFDVCGAYRERGLPRVESMQELRERLIK